VRTKAHSNNRYRDPVGDPGNHKKVSPVDGRGLASAAGGSLAHASRGRECHVKCRPATRGLHPCPSLQKCLYLQLRGVGLDSLALPHYRGASLDRSALHITLEDGEISFTTP